MLAPSSSGCLVGAVSIVLGYIYYWLAKGSSRDHDMPPGPPTKMIVGTNHHLEADESPVFFKYLKWKDMYGPLISMKNATCNVIVLQSADLVRALFDKKSAIYSNRPVSYFHHLLNNGNHLIFQRDHAVWRTSRKAITHHYAPIVCETEFVFLQEAESTQILWEFAEDWRRQREKDERRARLARLRQEREVARVRAIVDAQRSNQTAGVMSANFSAAARRQMIAQLVGGNGNDGPPAINVRFSQGLGWGDGFGFDPRRPPPQLAMLPPPTPVPRRRGMMRRVSDVSVVSVAPSVTSTVDAGARTPSLVSDDSDAALTEKEEERELERELMEEEPEPLLHSLSRYASSVLTCTTYGMRAPTYDSPACKGIQEFMNSGSDIRKPGIIPPIDAYPILNWVPDYFAKWRVRTKQVAKQMGAMYKSLFDAAVERANTPRLYDGVGGQGGSGGWNVDSFANRLYMAKGSHGLTDGQMHYLCGVVLEGGSDVVAIAITVCLMALVHNPDLQRIAHREIDAVVDEDTLPCWKDRKELHYVTMLAKEALRWRPPLPLGVGHSNDEDDFVGPYRIPKNSTICANIWAIHQDAARYPNPEVFNPERYRHDTTTMLESSRKFDGTRDHWAFGAGRRGCPGVQLADQGMFIAIARILWGFDLSVPEGYVLDISQETGFLGGGIRRPKPFPLIATPRSARRMETVERELGEARRHVFSMYGTE